jgi:hypothetical protein
MLLIPEGEYCGAWEVLLLPQVVQNNIVMFGEVVYWWVNASRMGDYCEEVNMPIDRHEGPILNAELLHLLNCILRLSCRRS